MSKSGKRMLPIKRAKSFEALERAFIIAVYGDAVRDLPFSNLDTGSQRFIDKTVKDQRDAVAAIRNADGGLSTAGGKPSRLSYDQYIVARTHWFKEWAGEWELDNAVSRLIDKTPVAVAVIEDSNSSRKAVAADARDKFKGKQFRVDGLSISVSGNALKHAISFTNDIRAAAVMQHLDEVLGSSVHVMSERPDPRKKHKTNVVAYHKLISPLMCNGQMMMARLTIQEDDKGCVYYDAAVDEIKKPEGESVGVAAISGDPHANGLHLAYLHSTARLFNVKPEFVAADVIMDSETGEPQVIDGCFVRKDGQRKSATGNVGTFSAKKDSILESSGPNKQKTICVDFDGVIADYSKGFQGKDVFGETLHGAGFSMGTLRENGWRVIIFTTRPDTPALREYLRENGIPYDYINENPDQPEGASGKVIADIYLDDRAMRFHGWADFRYALDAMVKEKILESAASGDWQTLKQLFENPPIMESAGDDEVIVMADDPADAPRLNAIANIQRAKTFHNLAEWFASAFDHGPAGGFPGLSDAVRNMDAIIVLAQKLKQWYALYQDEAADLDDRIDAQSQINDITNSYTLALPGGGTIRLQTFEKITGMELNAVKPLMIGKAYADLKLTEMRGKAQAVYEAAGVDPAVSLQRVKDINAEMQIAMDDLNRKTAPILQEYQNIFEGVKESNGYNGKVKESVDIINRFSSKRDFFIRNRPDNRPSSRAPQSEHDAFAEQWREWQQALDDLDAERQKVLGPIQSDLLRLFNEANDAAGDISGKLKPFNDEYNAFVAEKRAEIAAARAEIGKIKDHVLSQSPISKESADQWFNDMVLVPKNMQSNLKKRGYTPEKLKEDMTEFYRLTGGRLSRVSFETKGGQRAAAQPTTGVVYVAGEFSRSVFFHELAHVLEDDERTKALANRFIDQRTGRDQEGMNKVETLASLTGNRGYKSSEVAYKDSFIDPYVGKHYRNGITEVFSMGVQYFSSPEAMAVLAEKDPDHFAFMLGYLATAPRMDKGKVEQQQSAMSDQKDTMQTTEEFLKAIDKKIAKAGDFWSTEGFTIDSWKRYRGGMVFSATWIRDDGKLRSSGQVKSEKNMKRMLWLHIAAGKPDDGPYTLSRLSYDVFGQKNITISKEMAQDQAIQGAL